MTVFLDIVFYIMISLSFLCLYRVVRGPTLADRMAAIDIFGILVVGVCALLILKTKRGFIIDVGIAWIILSFVGTLTLAKYLSRRKLDD